MFELIKQLAPKGHFESCLTPDQRRKERNDTINQIVESLATPLFYQKPFTNCQMHTDPFHFVAYGGGETITVPAVCLLNNEDIPAYLRVSDPSDPRLNDEEWFKQLVDWLEKYLGTKVRSPKCIERDLYRLYLKVLQDPEHAKKAIKHVLGHELGHIVLRHRGWRNPGKLFLISSAGVGALLSYAIFSPTTNSGKIASLSLGALVLATTSFGLSLLREFRRSRAKEKAADLFSYKLDREAAEGACYVYDLMQKHFQEIKENLPRSSLTWKERMLYRLHLDSNGPRIARWTHGSAPERYNLAKNYLEHPPKNPFQVTWYSVN